MTALVDLEYKWSYKSSSYLFSYHPGSLILMKMAPQNFIDLAAPLIQFGSAYAATMKWMKERMEAGKEFDLPFLEVTDESKVSPENRVGSGRACRVTAHEGRHRMEAARDLGIKEVPVIIYFKEKTPYGDRPGEYAWTNPLVADQPCVQCDDIECGAHVQAEMKWEEDGEGWKEVPGDIKGLYGKRMEIDFCKIPDVRGATENWRKAQGIELDCD